MKRNELSLMNETEVSKHSKFEIDSDYIESYNAWYAHAAKAASHAASACS